MELRELVARALFNHQLRLRDWDHSKPWLQKTFLSKADEALRRSGVENIKLKTKIAKVENVR